MDMVCPGRLLMDVFLSGVGRSSMGVFASGWYVGEANGHDIGDLREDTKDKAGERDTERGSGAIDMQDVMWEGKKHDAK